jgi:hypothetical protein
MVVFSDAPRHPRVLMAAMLSACSQSALRAAQDTLLAHGLSPDRCDILQNGSTLVVRLTGDLVARVVQDREGPRQGTAWFERENAVAQHLTRRSAPVVQLHEALPAGPHWRDGFPLNFWRYVTILDRAPEPTQAGQTLRRCHEALRDLTEPLPRLAILHEAQSLLAERELLPAAEQSLVRRRLEAALAALHNAPAQPLHGDAHEGNLLVTADGLLWSDWEDAFVGPVEWDLASLIWNARLLESDTAAADAMLAGYRKAGGEFAETLLEHCLIARAAVMCAWYPILYPQPDATRRAKLRHRLDWLAALAD